MQRFQGLCVFLNKRKGIAEAELSALVSHLLGLKKVGGGRRGSRFSRSQLKRLHLRFRSNLEPCLGRPLFKGSSPSFGYMSSLRL